LTRPSRAASRKESRERERGERQKRDSCPKPSQTLNNTGTKKKKEFAREEEERKKGDFYEFPV
jgi:hypothetical protein